jgi:hypothetical protein
MGLFDDAPDDYKPWKNTYNPRCSCPDCVKYEQDMKQNQPLCNDGSQFPSGIAPTGSTFYVQDKIAYKYNEDRSIDEIKRYIDSTYSAHYKSEDNLQAIDAWFALGDADSSFRDTIIKYAWRLGKKEGHQKDLMKIIHYAIFYLEFCRRKGLK